MVIDAGDNCRRAFDHRHLTGDGDGDGDAAATTQRRAGRPAGEAMVPGWRADLRYLTPRSESAYCFNVKIYICHSISYNVPWPSTLNEGPRNATIAIEIDQSGVHRRVDRRTDGRTERETASQPTDRPRSSVEEAARSQSLLRPQTEAASSYAAA